MKSPKQLLAAQQHALDTVMTTIDGELLPSHPYLILRDMPTAPVPLIVGKTRDEGTVFVYPNYEDKLSEDMYRLYLTSYLPAMALDDMMKVYPCAADGDCRAALAAFAGDFALICPTVCFCFHFFVSRLKLNFFFRLFFFCVCFAGLVGESVCVEFSKSTSVQLPIHECLREHAAYRTDVRRISQL